MSAKVASTERLVPLEDNGNHADLVSKSACLIPTADVHRLSESLDD